jgi:hypothetical protein
MAVCRICSGCVERFWLVWKVYKLCRVRNPFEWSCSWYKTGYGVILTHRVWAWWLEFVVMHMIIMVTWPYPCGYYRCYINYHCHILLIIVLLICLSPLCLVRWDLLSTFVLTCLLLCFFSSRSRLRARRVRVEGVRTQVDSIGVSYLPRVVL